MVEQESIVCRGPHARCEEYWREYDARRRVFDRKALFGCVARKAELIIYDHHLMRDPLFRKRAAEVYETARLNNRKVLSAAKYLGQDMAVLKAEKRNFDM